LAHEFVGVNDDAEVHPIDRGIAGFDLDAAGKFAGRRNRHLALTPVYDGATAIAMDLGVEISIGLSAESFAANFFGVAPSK
jgi:hypothetical protein